MTLETKRIVIAALGGLFLLSLVLVQWMETARKAEEAGIRAPHVSVPASSRECVECHAEENPGIVPASLRVRPVELDQYQIIEQRLQNSAGVSEVRSAGPAVRRGGARGPGSR